jgi:hypothetical protein
VYSAVRHEDSCESFRSCERRTLRNPRVRIVEHLSAPQFLREIDDVAQ